MPITGLFEEYIIIGVPLHAFPARTIFACLCREQARLLYRLIGTLYFVNYFAPPFGSSSRTYRLKCATLSAAVAAKNDRDKPRPTNRLEPITARFYTPSKFLSFSIYLSFFFSFLFETPLPV